MINPFTCSICNSDASSNCECLLPFCSSCLDSHLHSYPEPQIPNNLLSLNKQHAQILSYLSSFPSRLSNLPKDSKLLSALELKNLIYLTFDSYPSNLPQFTITLKGNTLTIYDILSNSYRKFVIEDQKPTLASSLCYSTHYIFIVAGIVNFTPVDTIFFLDYKRPSQFGTLKLSQARYFCASACYEQYLFVVGGLDKKENALDTIEWFDLESGEKGVIKMSVARKRPSVTVFNGKVYIAGVDSERSVDIINIEDFSVTVENLSWAQGNIMMITHYSGKLVTVGDKGITSDMSNVKLETWDKLNDVWSQQGAIGLDSFLYFFDYFTGELIRILVADFRSFD